MSLQFNKPDGFAIDVIPVKSQMVPGAYCVSFTTDEPFEVRFTYRSREDGEPERARLYADTPLGETPQDRALGIYGVVEIIPDHTHVEIVPVEDSIQKAQRAVLEYGLSVVNTVSQTLHKQSDKQERETHE